MAKVGKKRSVVVDGEEQKQFENLGKAGICFSPDSRRLAYVTMIDKKQSKSVCLFTDNKQNHLSRFTKTWRRIQLNLATILLMDLVQQSKFEM